MLFSGMRGSRTGLSVPSVGMVPYNVLRGSSSRPAQTFMEENELETDSWLGVVEQAVSPKSRVWRTLQHQDDVCPGQGLSARI